MVVFKVFKGDSIKFAGMTVVKIADITSQGVTFDLMITGDEVETLNLNQKLLLLSLGCDFMPTRINIGPDRKTSAKVSCKANDGVTRFQHVKCHGKIN